MKARSFLLKVFMPAAVALALAAAFPSVQFWALALAVTVGFFLLFAGLEYLFYHLPSVGLVPMLAAVAVLGSLAGSAYLFREKLPEDFGDRARVASLGALAAIGAFSLRKKYRGSPRQKYPGADPFTRNRNGGRSTIWSSGFSF